MKMKRLKKNLCLTLCIVSVAVMTFSMQGCTSSENNTTVQNVDATTVQNVDATNVQNIEATTVGEGENNFPLLVIGDSERAFDVRTDENMVGKALLGLGLISGENGPYGLFINTVDGETVDFNKDNKYWAFYINGEYAVTGVDKTKIQNGTTYMLKVED